jgi:ribonuclease HI
MIPMYAFNKPFKIWLPDRSKWGKLRYHLKKGDSSGIQMGPRQMKALELGCAAMALNKVSVGQYTTVFQADVYAIKACDDENIKRRYRERNIYILADSEAAIKALDKFRITSKLVWDCRQSLVTLAEHKRVQLVWVPGHKGIAGDETADQLPKRGSLHPLIGPVPACGISERVAKRTVRDWVCREHQKYWQSTPEQTHANNFIPDLSAKIS